MKKRKKNITEDGYKAFYSGDIVNPYSWNTANYRQWEFGFNKAYFENLEKIVNG